MGSYIAIGYRFMRACMEWLIKFFTYITVSIANIAVHITNHYSYIAS